MISVRVVTSLAVRLVFAATCLVACTTVGPRVGQPFADTSVDATVVDTSVRDSRTDIGAVDASSDVASDGPRMRGQPCTRVGECGGTLRCIGQRQEPLAKVCCSPANDACDGQGQCCGYMECVNNVCQSQARSARCVGNIECPPRQDASSMYDTLLCVDGYCGHESLTCRAIFETCTNETQCCNAPQTSVACRPTTTFGQPRSACCIDAGNACVNNDGCCGLMVCSNGVCARSAVGDPCLEDRECASNNCVPETANGGICRI